MFVQVGYQHRNTEAPGDKLVNRLAVGQTFQAVRRSPHQFNGACRQVRLDLGGHRITDDDLLP
jgi:hypothetical protein